MITKKKNIKSVSYTQYSDKTCEEIANIIEVLTHSGAKILDEKEFNNLKNIFESSDKYVKETFDNVMKQLKEEHAEIRFSAFQICNELFRVSNSFRESVVTHLEQVVDLTTSKNLPPPVRVAQDLKVLAYKSLHEWNHNFGKSCIKLALSHDFLLRSKEDFSRIINGISTASSGQINSTVQQQQIINFEKCKKVLSEIKEKEIDIRTSLTSLSNSINLLLPHPEHFFITDDDAEEDLIPSSTMEYKSDSEEDGSEDTSLRNVGISGINHSVQLNFTPSAEVYVKMTPENSVIVDNVKEHGMLIGNKYLPTVKSWLERLTKSTEFSDDRRKIENLRKDMDDVLFKYNCLVFVSEEDVSTDSELEEVEEGQTPSSPTDKEPPLNSLPEQPGPSTSAKPQSRKEKLLAVAPKRPYDVDLYHWEDEKLPIPTMITNSTEGHRFWVGSDSSLQELPVPEGSAALRTRVIEFSGSFTPVNHVCRVRLPSGRLCPRRDRFKCPFHGEIVPRDDKGYCINPKDAIRMQQLDEKRQQEKPDWQNPKLLAEIKKKTGIDLKMPEKGKRKRRERKHPGLTDLNQFKNTPTKRLEKKIFKKSSVKKVAATLDRLDQRKFTDKFGDQFNYFYNS